MEIQFEPLVTKDLILIFSVLIVVIGWLVNAHLGRKFEIFKRRMDKRMTALESVLPILSQARTGNLDTPNTKENLENAGDLLRLYACQPEIDVYEKFIEAMIDKDLDKTNQYLRELSLMAPNAIRKDLGLPTKNINFPLKKNEKKSA